MHIIEREPAAASTAADAADLSAGSGTLAIERAGACSVVTRACAASPLRLLLPRNQGPGAWVYTSTYGGGLLGGDRIALDVDVGPAASCFISTQASTKVYRSQTVAESTLTACVASGALLSLVPDPVVCFKASRFRQSQRFHLDDEASLVFVDWVTAGRRAVGERWMFHEYVSRLEVRVNGRLVVHDAVALRAADFDVAERMGRFDVLGLVLLLGPQVRDCVADLTRSAPRSATASVDLTRSAPRSGTASGDLTRSAPRRAEQIVSVASVADGCLLRIAGTSVEQASATIRQWLDFLPGVLGDDPWARKW